MVQKPYPVRNDIYVLNKLNNISIETSGLQRKLLFDILLISYNYIRNAT